MRFARRASAPLFVLAASVSALAACGPAKGSHTDEGDGPPITLDGMTPSAVADAEKARTAHAIKTVFVIVMENHNWSSIAGNPSAPYINGTLLTQGAHAEHYTSPEGIHPSEPNYIWLEAGDDLDIADDDDPAANYRTTKTHLTTQMEIANVSWKSYQEAMTPGVCPLASSGRYAAKHNPFVFFDDVTGGRDAHSPRCIEHIREYGELAGALGSGASGAVAQYNFITPDMCNDMHDSAGCPSPDSVANGDAWLAREVPKILASEAYKAGGALFITWDESEGGNEPIGLIALSPFAKPGYAGTIAYTHSSLLRTIQDVFALRPFMRGAANAVSLEDLFVSYP
jgi:phospholipase C